VPPCPIDNTDEDHWSLPVGSRFWKEFVVEGKRIETRLIHRWGAGPFDFHMVAYQWDLDESDATLVEAFGGVQNANGTQHDIPGAGQCLECHKSLPAQILGFSAVQLSHANGGETMQTLSDAGKLLFPNPRGVTVPGTPVEQAGLGYLHANCGHCHHEAGSTGVDMFLRLLTTDAAVGETGAYVTAVDIPTQGDFPGVTARIEPGNRAASAVHYRMTVRAGSPVPGDQMPPLATEVVDDVGLEAVGTWIDAIP
jgi:hypothetical protein